MDAWTLPAGLNVGVLESTLRSLFDRVTRFEDKIGLSEVYSETASFRTPL